MRFVSLIGFLALSSSSGLLFVTAFLWLGNPHVVLGFLNADPSPDLDVRTLVLVGVPGSIVLAGCAIGLAWLAQLAAALGTRPLELTGRTVHLVPPWRPLVRQNADSAGLDAVRYAHLSPFIVAALAYATGWGLDHQGRSLTRIDVHQELAAPLAALVFALLLAYYSFIRYCRPLLHASNSSEAVASAAAVVVPRQLCIRKESAARLFGWPLVSIRYGPDGETGEQRGHARGIIAVGNSAIGVVAVGNLALGIFAVGAAAVGFFSAGGIAFGVLLAYGLGAVGTGITYALFSFGLLSAGVIAVGLVSAGTLAIGYFAFGAAGFGVHVSDSLGEPDPAAIEFVEKWLR